MNEKTYNVYEPELGNDLLAALRRPKNVSVLYAAAGDAAIKIEEQAAKIERLRAALHKLNWHFQESGYNDSRIDFVGTFFDAKRTIKEALNHEQSAGMDSTK